jgi:hypothetical protein
MFEYALGICNTPIRDAAFRIFRWRFITRMQPEFVTTDVEANVERLVKIWSKTKNGTVPGLGRIDVSDVIDGRP